MAMLSSVSTKRLNLFPFFSSIRSFSSSASHPRRTESISDSGLDTGHSYDPETVCRSLSCYGNDWKRALEFFNWVETDCQFKHRSETFNQMIDILGKFFEFNLSWDLIHRMKTDPLSAPNHTTFRIMFKRYIAAHYVNEARETFDRLEDFNLRDETSFCNLVDTLCEYKHVDEAHDLCFGKNRIVGFNVNDPKIYNMILRGWFKVGWWSKCREFWEQMEKSGVSKSLHSYSIYMDIMCKSGKPWKAVKLYKEMKRKGIKLDVIAYNTAIRAVSISEGVNFGLGLFREMSDCGCKPDVSTYNTIIKLLCENGRMNEAYKLLDQMPKQGLTPDVITYHSFFRCLEKPKEILALFDRMIERGVRPRMDTFVMLLRKFGRWGFLRPVFTVWKKMEELKVGPDEFAYNALIDALIEKGMLDMARKYDEEMLAKGLSPKLREELKSLEALSHS